MVILPSLATLAAEWISVQRLLPPSITTYAVDRPGVGWSDPGPWPGTPVALAAWTSRLFDALQVTSVVLVGHSTGGVIARVCATSEPGRVTGVVLVDSTHEHQMRRLRHVEWRASATGMLLYAAEWARCPAGRRRLTHDLRGRRALLREAAGQVPQEFVDAMAARSLSSAYRRADVQEKIGAAVGMRSVPASSRDLGALPLTVVTAGAADKGPGQAIWNELQASSFVTMSSRASHVVVAGSGHHINRDNPAAVAAAITAMVDRVRTDAVQRTEQPTTGL